MRRKGDRRTFKHNKRVDLTMTPATDQPFRWLPRQGEPSCIAEWLVQQTVRWMAYLPVYISIVVTLTLIMVWVTK